VIFFFSLSLFFRFHQRSIESVFQQFKSEGYLNNRLNLVPMLRHQGGEGTPADLPGPLLTKGTSKVVLVVNNLTAVAGDTRDVGSIPGSGKSPGGGHGNPLLRQTFNTEFPWKGLGIRKGGEN